jgi:hypothetical protein
VLGRGKGGGGYYLFLLLKRTFHQQVLSVHPLCRILHHRLPLLAGDKTHNLRQETLDAIASWETRQHLSNTNPDTVSIKNSGSGTPTLAPTKSIKSKASSAASRGSTLTLTALENVSFLSHMAEWRRIWALDTRDGPAERHEHFVRAARIYAHFVSFAYSEFPVNISSRIGKALHQVFDRAAHQLHGRGGSGSGSGADGEEDEDDDDEESRPGSRSTCALDQRTQIRYQPHGHHKHGTKADDDATPFGGRAGDEPLAFRAACGMDLQETLGKANLQSVTHMTDLAPTPGLLDLASPPAFCIEVFDDAEKEIKYLVLTNTWPKFVHAVRLENASQSEKKKRQQQRRGEKGGGSGDGDDEEAGAARVVERLRRMIWGVRD